MEQQVNHQKIFNPVFVQFKLETVDEVKQFANLLEDSDYENQYLNTISELSLIIEQNK